MTNLNIKASERLLHKVAIVLLLLILLITSIITSSAYAFGPYHLANKGASYQWGSNLQIPGSTMRTVWETAISDWANTASTNYYYLPNSVNEFDTYSEADTSYFGKTFYLEHDGKILKSFSANLNMLNTTITTNTTVARSTANHEIGHTLGIDHVTSGTAIMNTSRDRTQIYIPRYDDKLGVQALYDAVLSSEEG